VITIRSGGHEVGGTIVGTQSNMRVVYMDGHELDVRPSRNMLIIRNADLPGVIGRVGTALGSAGVNIKTMNVGEATEANALMIIGTDHPASAEALEKLSSIEQVWSVKPVTLDSAPL
jgi:D-3-phosphoglycerate dehydrogenase